MESVDISGRTIGAEEPTFIIAEAGSNHDGKFKRAKELIDKAANAGVDAVKFQTFRVEQMYRGGRNQNLQDTFSQYEMPYDWIPRLHEYCEDRGVLFLSTPFDEQSADELAEYVPAFKIASLTASHKPLLEHVGQYNKPVILSTGAQTINEVRESVEILRDAGTDEIVLLQCVSSYPTPLEDSNIRVIDTLQEQFGVPSGLSDHTLDPIVAPMAAVARGGAVIEKHFTTDNSREGLDHSYALEPDELKTMVSMIRDTETALGSPEKTVLPVEQDLRESARRSLQAAQDIPEGTKITRDDVAILRPGEHNRGLDPNFLDVVVGATVLEQLEQGAGITWDVINRDAPGDLSIDP